MSNSVVVKEEVTSEVKEEDKEELKRRRRKERIAVYKREMRERIRRVCAGEDVPGVGDEERRKILEKEEKRKERRALIMRERREEVRRICAGEDVPGVGEEERKRILEKEEKQRERNVLKIRERRELVRRICAGEDVPGVSEEQRRKIIEKEETRKQKDREYKRKLSETNDERKERWALCERERKERIRSICAGEYVPGVGEEERMRVIEKEEKRKEMKRLSNRKGRVKKRMKEETAEEKEARIARNKFNNFVWRVQMTDEEKEEMRRRNYFRRQARLAMMSEEEREAEKRRRNEWHREWRKNLSEEKRRKHAEALERASKKWKQKWKERDPERFKKNKTYNKELWERMSEEEKRRRLNQMKMYQQKRNLRRKLEGTIDNEEIERRLDELDKRLREELGIGPPRPRGFFGKKGSDCGDVIVGATCSNKISTLPVDKQEVGQWLDNSVANLITTTSYPDSGTAQIEQAESNFCDFDDDDAGVSMPPSPPEATQLFTPPPQQVAEFTFSCEYCECSPFLSENDLKSHLQDNHLKICWKCPSCKEVMISSKHLSEHFKAVHKRPSMNVDSQTPQKHPAKEPEPQNVSHDKSNSRKSGNFFIRKGEYLCLKCPLKKLVNSSKIITVFKDWRGLHSHVRNKHRKYYWPCEFCHLLKYSKRSLIVHLMLCTKKSEN